MEPLTSIIMSSEFFLQNVTPFETLSYRICKTIWWVPVGLSIVVCDFSALFHGSENQCNVFPDWSFSLYIYWCYILRRFFLMCLLSGCVWVQALTHVSPTFNCLLYPSGHQVSDPLDEVKVFDQWTLPLSIITPSVCFLFQGKILESDSWWHHQQKHPWLKNQ